MKKPKYLIVVMLALTITSCSDDDDGHAFYLEYAKVLNANVPEQFQYGHTYQINMTVELPNSCYFFYNQFDYFYDGNSRLVYPIAHVDIEDTCEPIITEDELIISVRALQSEPYLFKFYQGKDENGEDLFLTIEVPVITDDSDE
ncbi:hypothetical protein [Pontimicrobium sp. IMCC45349]|uniref:hypothetical protein n=1 Tax=Pontimicrobium sp. IMCC45349 TaxID=3391574 RepID=UPI0039A176C8